MLPVLFLLASPDSIAEHLALKRFSKTNLRVGLYVVDVLDKHVNLSATENTVSPF